MKALVGLLAVAAFVPRAAGDDNGVWKGDDDRPERIHYPHHHDEDVPIRFLSALSDAITPAPALNVSRPVSVFDSGQRQPKDSDDDVFVHDDDFDTIVIDGRDRDYDDAVEYERYSGPHHESRYDDDDDDDADRYHDHHHHEPVSYHEDDHHDHHRYPSDDRQRYNYDGDDEILAERARMSFDDEIEPDMPEDHYVREADLAPDRRRYAPLSEADRRYAPRSANVLSDNSSSSGGGGDYFDGIDSGTYGSGHDVIELPSFMAPVARNKHDDTAVVLIGDMDR